MNGLLCVFVAGCDLAIKTWVRHVPIGVTIFEVSGIVQIQRCENSGVAFSFLSGHTMLAALLSIMLLTLLCVLLMRLHLTHLARHAIAVLLGGGIGNLLDRVLHGSVTDYIRVLFVDFPVFNFADICITLSVIALFILGMTNRLEEKV